MYGYRNPYNPNDQRFFGFFGLPLAGAFLGGLIGGGIGGGLGSAFFNRPFYGYPYPMYPYPGMGFGGYPYYY